MYIDWFAKLATHAAGFVAKYFFHHFRQAHSEEPDTNHPCVVSDSVIQLVFAHGTLQRYDDWTSNLANVLRSFEVDLDPIAAAEFYFFAQNFLLTRTWNPRCSHEQVIKLFASLNIAFSQVINQHHILGLQAGERVTTSALAQFVATQAQPTKQ
jgi:hypothetical protein